MFWKSRQASLATALQGSKLSRCVPSLTTAPNLLQPPTQWVLPAGADLGIQRGIQPSQAAPSPPSHPSKPESLAALQPGPAHAWQRLNLTCQSCKGSTFPVMLSRVGDLSCILVPHQMVSLRYLLHQTKHCCLAPGQALLRLPEEPAS